MGGGGRGGVAGPGAYMHITLVIKDPISIHCSDKPSIRNAIKSEGPTK